MKKITLFALVLAGAAGLTGCSGEKNIDQKMSEAVAQAKQNKWQNAAKMASEMSAAVPNAASPVLLQAIAYEKSGEYDKALDLARQCAAANPENFTCVYTFGRLSAADKKRRSEAFVILEKALQLNPGDRDTLVLLCNLGTMLNHPRVLQYLGELHRHKEFASSATLYYQYGFVFAMRRDKDRALLFLRHAVKNSGSNPDLILYAARCIDRFNLSKEQALAMYRLYLKHPGKKNAAAVAEAAKRVAGLSK